jgi:hypothetical protein
MFFTAITRRVHRMGHIAFILCIMLVSALAASAYYGISMGLLSAATAPAYISDFCTVYNLPGEILRHVRFVRLANENKLSYGATKDSMGQFAYRNLKKNVDKYVSFFTK